MSLKRTLPVLLGFMTSLSAAQENNFWTEDVWKSDERGFLYYPSDKHKEDKPAPLDLKGIPTIEGLREERKAPQYSRHESNRRKHETLFRG